MRAILLYSLLFIGCEGTIGVATSPQGPTDIKVRLFFYDKPSPIEYCFPPDTIVYKCTDTCGICQWEDNDWALECHSPAPTITFNCKINCNECKE